MLLRPAVSAYAFLGAFIVGACSGNPDRQASATASRTDSSHAETPDRDRSPPPPSWDSAFGAFIGYYAGDSSVVVLLPSFADAHHADTTSFDASSANGTRVELFSAVGSVGSGVVGGLAKSSDDEGCFEFSRGHINGIGGERWAVALPAGSARPLSLRRLSSLHATDSASFVGQIVQLAGMLYAARDTEWRDAPFLVEDGAELSLSDARVIAASVMRMLPGPQHYSQNYFFVAESQQTSAGQTRDWQIAYVHPDRSNPPDTTRSGLDLEDEVGVAAAVTTRSDSMPVLLLETRGNEVNGYAAVGRAAPGRWRVVWSGPHEGGC